MKLAFRTLILLTLGATWLGCAGRCTADSDCNDQNRCTQDRCVNEACTHQDVTLDDKNACTLDVCDPATGVQRVRVATDDNDECTSDWCEPTSGVKHARVYTGACAATQLAFRTQPAAGEVNLALIPPVQVELRGSTGSLVTAANTPVHIDLGTTGVGLSVQGSTSVTPVNGVATFSDLRIDGPGNALQLRASAARVTEALSAPFNVYTPCPPGLTRNSGGTCVDHCSTGSNPCVTAPEGVCQSPAAGVNYSSPGTCTPNGVLPFYACQYGETSFPCTSPPDECTSTTVLRHRVVACATHLGVAACGTTTTNTDCSLSARVCRDAACVPPPTLTAVTPSVAAHGATVVITGSSFLGASAVTIENVSQAFTVNSDTQITIDSLHDSTPLNLQWVKVVNAGTSSNVLPVTVIHLVINEVDSVPAGGIHGEFVELSTGGVGGVSLAPYVLVFFRADNHQSYYSTTGLSASADGNGYFIAGNAQTVPDQTFPNGALRNGPGAVALYQAAPFPDGTSATTPPVGAKLIDAMVYTGIEDEPDDGLLLLTLPIQGPGITPDFEDANGKEQLESMHRCKANQLRRDSNAFSTSCVAAPSRRGPSP